MTPEVKVNIARVETVAYPSKTYKIDVKAGRIVGYTDGIEAMVQAVYKILNTERFAYLIYDWGYGTELNRFIGQDFDFIVSDLERAITEALQQDDRFISIKDFTVVQTERDSVEATFTVVTTVGELTYSNEVSV